MKDYVRSRRQSTREAFVPLHHPPGHAQVDFGEARAVIGGLARKLHFWSLVCFGEGRGMYGVELYAAVRLAGTCPRASGNVRSPLRAIGMASRFVSWLHSGDPGAWARA